MPGSKQPQHTGAEGSDTHTHTHPSSGILRPRSHLAGSHAPLSLNGRDAGRRGSCSRPFGGIWQDLFQRKRKKTLRLLLALLGNCSLDASGFVHHQLLVQIPELFYTESRSFIAVIYSVCTLTRAAFPFSSEVTEGELSTAEHERQTCRNKLPGLQLFGTLSSKSLRTQDCLWKETLCNG